MPSANLSTARWLPVLLSPVLTGTLGPPVKALAITGYALQQSTEALKAEGFMDVVHKPFNIDDLARVIRQCLKAE